MTPLSQVPGFPAAAIARLADYGMDTAERFLRSAGRPDTRRDLEQILGPSILNMALAAVQRALAADEPVPEAALEPEERSTPSRATARPAGRFRADEGMIEAGEERIEGIREKLGTLAERRWAEVLGKLQDRLLPPSLSIAELNRDEDTYAGRYVVLQGVDPTHQFGDTKDHTILHPSRPYGHWAIPLDTYTTAVTRKVREVQTELGFPRETRWDVIGQFEKVSWNSGTLDKTHDDMPFLRIKAVRIPGQFAVFLHSQQGPTVPGFDSAREVLGKARGNSDVPPGAEPIELLDVLSNALTLNNVDLFRRLWVSSTSDSDLRYSFVQFDKAFEAGGRAIAFDRYDPSKCPENYPGCGEVKLFVRRETSTGSIVRPLTFVQERGEWRLQSGTI